MKLRLFIALAFLLFASYLLTSCSWEVRFYISNMTDAPVDIQVTLKKIERGFPIFKYKSLTRYELRKNGYVSHQKIETVTPEMDDNTLTYKYQLQPNYALSIGVLNNDNYKSYDQYFINDRVFNLEKIIIGYKNTTIEIVPETFDDYFKVMKRGGVYYTIR